MTRVIVAGALVGLVVSSGCAHSQRRLYPGAVSGSRRAVPEWVDFAEGIPCGKGETCVIGVSRCAADGPQALDASRMSGYARLASMAFPVDVAGVWKDFQTIELSGGREESRTVLSDDVRTELGGRVSGARVVDDYWSLRRVHSLGGVADCYDGWSLMSISTVALESLYPRELERSAREVERVGRELFPIEQALKSDDSVFFENVPVALSVFRSAEVALAGLQPVVGLPELRGRLAAAEGRLGTRMQVSLRSASYPADGTVSAVLSVEASGRPLTGMELTLDGCGLESYGAVTDSAGLTVVHLTHDNLFAQCALGVRFRGVSGFTAAIQVPPAYSGATVGVSASAAGFLSARLESYAGSLARAEGARLSRPRTSAGRPVVDLTISVSVSTRQPVPYNGRVSLVSGSVDVGVTGWADGRQVLSVSAVRRELRALGLDQAQLAGALETQIGQAVTDAVASFRDRLLGASAR